MKILAVRFQNLNSLKGEHEIRFDRSPLADAGLFAITGQTGAGKTTILDAITVGLYGLVHRHSNDKPLELMTRHTAESFSEVEFEAEGKSYRSKWQIRRSRGKADGKMQAVHMELYDFTENTLFDLKPSEVPAKVAELCGLDYNQFLRSVMLSQGDFARFLKASANERSSLLEKITDTGIYSDISRFAYEKAKAERTKREELERRLQDTPLLPEEQREAYTLNVTALDAADAELLADVNSLQEQIQWLQQLEQLQAKQAHFKAACQQQDEKLSQLGPDFLRLQKHEHARQYEGQLARIEVTNGQLVQHEAQLTRLVKQIPVLEAELEMTGRVALEAGKTHQQQEETLRALEPLLNQVTKLDHQVQTVRDLYQKNKVTYIQFEEHLKQEQQLFKEKKEELAILTQKAQALKQWLQQNIRLQDLRENLPEFRRTIRDLGQVENSIKQLRKEEQQIQEVLTQDTKQKEALHTQLEAQTQQQATLEEQKQEKVTQLQQVLQHRNLEELEVLAREQPKILARYERLHELAQSFGVQEKKREQCTRQSARYEQDISGQQSLLEKTRQDYSAATEKLKDLQQLVALQQRIAEYEQARQSLHPNEPCPLCGSEHHPFAEGNYSQTLSEDEQRRDKQAGLVKELESSLASMQLHLHTLQHQQEATHLAKAESETEISRLQLLYAQPGQQIDIPISAPERLASALLRQQEASAGLNDTLNQAQTLRKEIEIYSGQLQQLREDQLKKEGQLSRLQQAEKTQQGQLLKVVEQLQDLSEQQKAFTETAVSFASSYAFIYQHGKSQEVLQAFETQVGAYQLQQEAYEALRDPFLQLQEQVKNLTSKLAEKEKELDERRENLKQEYVHLTALKEERTLLFGEKDPQKERQKVQQELKESAYKAEEARTALLAKQQQLHDCRQRELEYTASHQQHKSVLDELRDGLLRVLHLEGIDTLEALSQMLLEKDEANRLSNLKAQVEKHLTELRKSLADVEEDLTQVRSKNLTALTAEELGQQHAQKTQEHRELISRRARILQLLEQDVAQREKSKLVAGQLQAQQLVCNRWEQLANLIGSADGNKFSRFAQGLTLARLVELANRHLQKLNDRYHILQSSEEDLELLIADTYQAEAIRPMNTLSGGESFLVSLALALGLSDLAGRRTQINSLFIDEGFGTLDAETLDAAITTLENLQASGKMIGIISHVEALKERIGTQIRVQKQAGGISTVQISGYA